MSTRHALFASGILVALAACGKVSDVNQRPDAIVLDWRTPSGVHAAPSRTEKLLVGSQEKGKDYRVPVTVEWGVQKDDAGCQRVTSVKMTRTGGPTSMEIYGAKAKPMSPGCATRAATSTKPAASTEPFDSVSVSYCWRWNGASNDDTCAYGGAFTISGDVVGLEGIVDRQP